MHDTNKTATHYRIDQVVARGGVDRSERNGRTNETGKVHQAPEGGSVPRVRSGERTIVTLHLSQIMASSPI